MGPLTDGDRSRASVECEEHNLLDTVVGLCDDLGPLCTGATAECHTYQRQLFAGTVFSGEGGSWNGYGGGGQEASDHILCSLEQLRSGPIDQQASIPLGLGDLVVRSTWGYDSFRKVNPVFRGWRKMYADIPVIGSLDVLAHDFSVERYRRTWVGGTPPAAGDFILREAHGLTLTVEEASRRVLISPGSFPVVTPLGEIDVRPEFLLATRSRVHDPAFQGEEGTSVQVDDTTFVFEDVFGVDPGVEFVRQPFPADEGLGWISLAGMGARSPLFEPLVWDRGTGPFPPLRPDANVLVARSEAETAPNLEASALARATYPDDPREYLPGWIFSFPVDFKLQAFAQPEVRVAATDQLNLAVLETVTHRLEGEISRVPDQHRLSSSVYGGLQINGGFLLTAGLDFRIVLEFPFPIDTITVIDVAPRITIPIVELEDHGMYPSAIWTSQIYPDRDDVTELHTSLLDGVPDSAAWIDECYAPDTDDPPARPEPAPYTPGDAQDLFDADLWPCNVCLGHGDIFVDGMVVMNGKDVHVEIEEEARTWLWMPSGDGAHGPEGSAQWTCDRVSNVGCMDLCRMDPDTGRLTDVVHDAVDMGARGEGRLRCQ